MFLRRATRGSHRDGTKHRWVLAAHSDSLMALPGVVGTAIGLCDGARCIKVFLATRGKRRKRRIPRIWRATASSRGD